MGEIPQYYLPVDLLPSLKDHFSATRLQLVCTEEWCLQRNNSTYCAEWELQSEGQQAFISARQDSTNFDLAVLTVFSVQGKRDRLLVQKVQQVLAKSSVRIDNIKNQA